MTSVRPIPAPLQRPIRLGVLISGGGTTLSNFVQKISAGQLNAEVTRVIASRPNCAGLARAVEAGLETVVVPRRECSGVDEFSGLVFDHLRTAEVELVALGGFLSMLWIPDDFQFKVLNIHPALIPSFCGQGFYGEAVHKAVLDRGVKISGCTVHFADNEYDHGPIILQQAVPVLDDDTPQTLAARVFEAECEAYPEAIRLFAAGRLEIDGSRVRVLRKSD